MNFLDILLAIPLGYFIYKGYKRGLIFEIACLFGVVAGCYLAVRFAKLTSDVLPFEGEGTILVAFFILFVGVLLLSRVMGRALEGVVKLIHAGFANKLLGAALGFAKVVCVLAVIINYVMLIDDKQELVTQEVQENSIFFKPVHSVGNKLTARLETYVDELKAKKAQHDQEKGAGE